MISEGRPGVDNKYMLENGKMSSELYDRCWRSTRWLIKKQASFGLTFLRTSTNELGSLASLSAMGGRSISKLDTVRSVSFFAVRHLF